MCQHNEHCRRLRLCATKLAVSYPCGCLSSVIICAQAGALMAEVDWEARKKQKTVLTELLTRHLLTLDSIQATGAAETPPEVNLSSVRRMLFN